MIDSSVPATATGFVLAAVLSFASSAGAHHPPSAPRASSPHAIGGRSEVSLSWQVMRIDREGPSSPATVQRLSADADFWVLPWLALQASLPLQMLHTDLGNDYGVGNAALGGVLRGDYGNGVELLLSASLRLPTWSESFGAHLGTAVVPQAVLAWRDKVTLFAGGYALLGLGGEPRPDPLDLLPPAPGSSDEVGGFGGLSVAGGRAEGHLEIRVVGELGEAGETYVAVSPGAALVVTESASFGAAVELPVGGDRLDWSALLRFTHSL